LTAAHHLIDGLIAADDDATPTTEMSTGQIRIEEMEELLLPSSFLPNPQ